MAGEPAELNVPAGAVKAMAWFFENSLDVFLAVRRNGHTRANPTWKKLTGWDLPEARGQSFWDFVHPDDRDAARVEIEHLQNTERCVVELRLSIAEGGWFWTRTHVVGGEDGWALLIVRDIRLEQAALAAAEAKARFLANMSHEIRTPMNGVIGILHLLEANPSRQERQRLVAEALASGVGLSDLLNDIIDYSDVEAGRLELLPEPLDPVAELQSVLALFQARALEKGLALRMTSADDIGWVRGDPARLRKIFFHLVGNAVKFTQHGSVNAMLSADGQGEARRLRLEVSDTGIGISKDEHANLFERFSQGDGSSTRRFGGPGLGLAVTKRLAEMMGGTVGFESVRGEGSTFWVELSAPAREDPQERGSGEAWLSGLRVLVVEDNPTNRLVATKMLGLLGAEVQTADDGLQGVAAVERSDFDLVFMDIQMPVMDGVEATRRIRAMARPKCDTTIVATTANVLPEQLATYRQSGINGVVAKPISPSALLAEIARVAGGSEEAEVAEDVLLA
jgi:PAS domain S-box-containing protein